jgi:ectoine hydroxylase-related dioxygenase (phytanoyl-CoA dioxygenase family)
MGTCWVPLGDIAVQDGVCVVLPGTSTLPEFSKSRSFENAQIPASFEAKKGENVKGLEWRTTAFAAGDVMIFGSQTVHCSSKNYGKKPRLSVDFRFYLAPDREGRKKGDNTHREYVEKKTEPF